MLSKKLDEQIWRHHGIILHIKTKYNSYSTQYRQCIKHINFNNTVNASIDVVNFAGTDIAGAASTSVVAAIGTVAVYVAVAAISIAVIDVAYTA